MIGFVLVDKPPGPTSHDVVDVVRRALKTRRVGHAGTLDPPASGLVVVAVGAATRLLRFVGAQPKTYTTTGVLGVRTTTLDAAGEVVSREPVGVDRSQLEEVLGRFRGKISQVPPAVSAVKVGGVRAYKRAARGEDVTIEPRTVTVHELHLTDFDPPRLGLEVRCSGGTYVRSLVADIGDALGCGAHVAELRRTAIGSLAVAEAVAPDEVDASRVLAVEVGLRDLVAVDVDAATAALARNGRTLDVAAPQGEVLVRDPGGPVGVFESAGGILRPITVLPTEPGA